MRPPRGLGGLLLVAAVAALASGCASAAVAPGMARSDLEAAIRIRGLDPREVVVPFAVGSEALAWLKESSPRHGTPGDRLRSLLGRLMEEKGLGVIYERAFTGTADEVFALRRANCLGFMNLFVGLARELEITAFFVAVEDESSYDREGDLVLVSDHVAAGFGSGGDFLLLDFVEGPTPEYSSLRPLTDLEAVAKYYSNRGAELMRDGRAREAAAWLETAVRLEPELAASWVNLGVARRRTGDLAGAEAAYQRALELDPETASAYQNLAALLRLKGRTEEARSLLALIRRLNARNPYSFLSLGDWSLEAGRVEEARRFYRRALTLGAGRVEPAARRAASTDAPPAPQRTAEAEAAAALGELELVAGHPDRALRWLRRAQRLDPAGDRATRLAASLGRGPGT
jgi:tetratricopeptide (TPR) repeat protein